MSWVIWIRFYWIHLCTNPELFDCLSCWNPPTACCCPQQASLQGLHWEVKSGAWFPPNMSLRMETKMLNPGLNQRGLCFSWCFMSPHGVAPSASLVHIVRYCQLRIPGGQESTIWCLKFLTLNSNAGILRSKIWGITYLPNIIITNLPIIIPNPLCFRLTWSWVGLRHAQPPSSRISRVSSDQQQYFIANYLCFQQTKVIWGVYLLFQQMELNPSDLLISYRLHIRRVGKVSH